MIFKTGFPGDLLCDTIVIGLNCSVIVDKVEKVTTGEVFSVGNIDFAVVVLGCKEVVAVDNASFPYEGSEGREIFKEIGELDGEKGKTDGFLVEMLVILSTCDVSGCVFNNVVSVPLKRVSGDPVMDVV